MDHDENIKKLKASRESFRQRRELAKKEDYADYRHVLLYAKHHYETTDIIEDLRIILSKRCLLSLEHTTNEAIWGNMVHCLEKYATPDELLRLLQNLFDPSYDEEYPIMTCWSDVCPFQRALNKALTILSTVQVNDRGNVLINLGKADPNILPLRKKEEETA